MPEPIRFDDLPGNPDRAKKFVGKEHGSGVSFFLSRHATGEGPDLHLHPYEEVFVIYEGVATFTVGDQSIEAGPGEIVVVPPNRPHKFKNTGDERLRLVGIHPSPEVIQEDLE
jgi:mannose-6-phosphate isomerase-like protein (cupin superfamily)